jgi:uncharacterized protein (UPF0332 family)/predicted nucleotidyltransferase
MTTVTKTRSRGKHKEVANMFAERLFDGMPEVRSVILFGSVARGTEHGFSDIDVLVLCDPLEESVRDRVWDTELSVHEDEPSAIIHPLIYSAEEFSEMLQGGFPLARDVVREGIALSDDGAFERLLSQAPVILANWSERMSDPDSKFIKEKVDHAEEALASAKILLAEGLYWSVADRAYYGAFLAAEASLALIGIEPGKTHDGVIEQFGRYLAKPGLFPRRYHSELEKAKAVRRDSTYGGRKAASERQAKQLVDLAETLLADVKRLAEEKRK